MNQQRVHASWGAGGANPTSEAILGALANGPATRAQIAASTGLPLSTVTGYVRLLLRRGLVEERPETPAGRRGRRPALLWITAPVPLVAVVVLSHGNDLADGDVHVALATVDGTLLEQRSQPGHQKPLAVGIDLIRSAIKDADVEPDRIRIGILGVPFPLIVPRSGGPQIAARIVPPFDSVLGAQPQHRLARALNSPVLLANDADLGALGEAAFGAARAFGSAAYLKVLTGLGMGLVFRGELFTAAVTAGEIAHLRVDDAQGRCLCGGRGCLWSSLSDRLGLLGMLRFAGVHVHTLADARLAAANGDREVIDALGMLGTHFGRAAQPGLFLTQTTVLVLEEELGPLHAPLAQGLEQALMDRRPAWAPQCTVVPGELGVRAELLGGVRFAAAFPLVDGSISAFPLTFSGNPD